MSTATNAVADLEKQIEGLKKQLVELRKKEQRQAVRDYEFQLPGGGTANLSDFFGDKQDLIVVHNMGQRCVYCTLWADGFIGFAKHLEDRAGFVLVSPDAPDALKEFSEGRGWNFKTASAEGTTFIADMGFEPKPGEYWPGCSTFRKMPDGTIERVAFAHFGPGDDFCSIWHLFALLQDGDNDWEPKYKYGG